MLRAAWRLLQFPSPIVSLQGAQQLNQRVVESALIEGRLTASEESPPMNSRAGLFEDAVSVPGRNGTSRPVPDTARLSEVKSNPVRAHVLTVALEDYFHAAPFRPWVREEIWYRFEDRLGASTRRMLELFHRCNARATFFVTARTAEAAPDLVREIARQGHEIAAAGDHGHDLRKLDRQRFRAAAADSRNRVEQIVGHRVLGYRIASAWLSPADLWILDVLADVGIPL